MSGARSDTRYFYRDLPASEDFSRATDLQKHVEIPEDWWVVVTDVLGSTKAIAEGRYKDVNSIGASTIIAVINVDRSIPIPYVFGGDGATLAVPPSMEHGTRQALLGARKMAVEGFGLDLRIGMVPVKLLREKDYYVRLVKYRLSEKIQQAAISGRGWDHAETLIKSPETRESFEVQARTGLEAIADFTGFECRWRGIPPRGDHKLCVLARSIAKDPAQHSEILARVLEKIQEIFGNVHDYHPISADRLGLTFDPRRLQSEAAVRSSRTSLGRWLYILKGLGINLLGTLLMRTGIKAMGTNWGRYEQEVVEHADFQKFDGTLRMVIDSTTEQTRKLRVFLDELWMRRELAWGLHEAPEALITCMVFSHSDDHTHFIDGSGGGYTLASKQLKDHIQQFRDEGRITATGSYNRSPAGP